MTRAERRRSKRTDRKKTKTVNLTAEQIERKKRQITDIALRELFGEVLCISLLALKDEFGFGRTRLNRFTDKFLDIWDSWHRNYVRTDDIWDVLKEEVGITRERLIR